MVALDGSLRDFITMQVIGISTYIIAANLSGRLSDRYGAEPLIVAGSVLALFGALLLLGYGLLGGRSAAVIWAFFVPFNMGFGFRGPPAVFLALKASDGDDGRASALIILYVMLFTAAGTALLAPVVARGLAPAAAAAALLGALSLLWLRVLPRPVDH